ncbi:MAG: hypothetical protein ABI602_02255 [Candidatus Saccharibacteria bacterium]
MRKGTIFLGTCLTAIGALRLAVPFSFSQVAALDPLVALLALGVGVMALVNGSDYMQLVDLRPVFKAFGLTLLLTVLLGINSPTFVDIRQTYIPITDLFIGLECSIVLFLLTTEEPAAVKAPPLLIYISLVIPHMYHRLMARLSLVPANPRRKHAQ